MAIPCNCDYYDKMTDEDIVWLKENTPECFYQAAIIDRMQMAKKYYREVYMPSLPESAWNC